MTYNVFGGTLSLTQSLNNSVTHVKYPVAISGAISHFGRIRNWNQAAKNGRYSDQLEPDIWYIINIHWTHGSIYHDLLSRPS